MARRIFASCSLLALALLLDAALASGAGRPSGGPIRVVREAGITHTVFVLDVRVPDRTGLYGSSQRYDLLTASAVKRGGGCIATLAVRVPDAAANALVRVALDPRRLGGRWCAGVYRGRIEELQTVVCPSQRCTTRVLVRGVVGRFAFHVRSPRRSAGASPPAGAPPASNLPPGGSPPPVSNPPPGSNPPPTSTPPPGGGATTAPSFAGLQRAFACTPGPQRPGQTTPYNLSWQAASDDVTPSAQIVYDVYLASMPGGEDFSRPTWTTAPGATSFTAPGLPSHGTFYFVVRARDSAGNEDRNTVERHGEDPCV